MNFCLQVGNPAQDLLGGAYQVVVVFGAIFSLLNCFFGYKLVKLWSALAGFAVGWVAGFAIVLHFLGNAGISALAGVVAGLGLAAVAFFIYRAGVFVFCFFLTLYFSAAFIPDWPGVLLGVILGILVGVLAMKYMQMVLIITSSISGGMNAANTLLTLFAMNLDPVVWFTGIILAAGGIAVQLSAAKKRREIDL